MEDPNAPMNESTPPKREGIPYETLEKIAQGYLDEQRAFVALQEQEGAALRERTVPIPETITPVPGYPRKLVVYKMAAKSSAPLSAILC